MKTEDVGKGKGKGKEKKTRGCFLVFGVLCVSFLWASIYLPSYLSYRERKKVDEHFIKEDKGVVKDRRTGLEWYAGPDKNTNWNEAKSWIENLNVAGGGWRMPTRKELKYLYQKGVGIRNMTPLLKTTGWWVWTSETKGSSSAWGFHFIHGGEYFSSRDELQKKRGFAVRSRR